MREKIAAARYNSHWRDGSGWDFEEAKKHSSMEFEVQMSYSETDQILTLIRGGIEKVENPYHEEVMDEAYNIYPEFAVFEEARQAILKALEV